MRGNTIIIIICLVLAAFAVYREYQRDNKAHLGWRILAALVAILALACVALPISYSTTITERNEPGKVLLTQGFSKDSLPKNDSVFTLDKAVKLKYPKAKLLDNIDDLFSDSAHISPVHIYGYGVDHDQLKQFSSKPVTFNPAPIPDGFIAASWTERVKTGQSFTVHGTYKNTSGKAYKLLLKGLNTTLDSVVIPLGSQHSFTLTATSKNRGRMVYSLLVLDGKDTIQNEQLPIIIEPAQLIKVLILSASPDFETKFLREWLGGNGYSVASRSNITKGKIGQDFINMDQFDLTHLTASTLAKFDVVIGDLSVLKNLTQPESLALQTEVTQKGLGVIIRADSSNKNTSWLQSNFPVNHQTGKQTAPATLTIQGYGKTAPLTIDPDFIIAQANTQRLVTDLRNQMLSGLAMDGAGKLAFTTIHNSYAWTLAGNQKDYNALWSLLIDKTIRKASAAAQWSVKSSVPLVNQPVELVAESASPLPTVSINNTTVYPAQNPAVPFQQSFTYWPSAYGWQWVSAGDSPPFWWYVWDATSWQTLRAAERVDLNNRFFKRIETKDVSVRQKTKASVPKIYFYILFLMAVTFLWAETKFYN